MATFKFTGTWNSERYPGLNGTVDIDLPHQYGEFDSTLTITYDSTGSFRAGETRQFPLQGKFMRDNKDVERYILMPQELGMGQLFTLTFVQHPATNKWSGFYTCVYPYDIGRMNITCTVTCSGCLEEQPNQLAHMDYGGCLHEESDSEDTVVLSDDPPRFDYRSLPQL
jgi:hypothetical protein